MSDIQSLTNRIDELEIRLAHQDQIVEELNETITRQWKEIELLSRHMAKLGERVHAVEENVGDPAPTEPPPPHY